MNKPVFLLLVFVFFAMLSCTATMVANPGKGNGSEYAPINESQRKGLIKYLIDGAANVVESRRQDAYEQMHQACGGKYIITREQVMPEGMVAIPVSTGTGTMYAGGSSMYNYIEFECVLSE